MRGAQSSAAVGLRWHPSWWVHRRGWVWLLRNSDVSEQCSVAGCSENGCFTFKQMCLLHSRAAAAMKNGGFNEVEECSTEMSVRLLTCLSVWKLSGLIIQGRRWDEFPSLWFFIFFRSAAKTSDLWVQEQQWEREVQSGRKKKKDNKDVLNETEMMGRKSRVVETHRGKENRNVQWQHWFS